ncbi:MAG: lasso RiPP family leader peptide-containing protein [Deltaproteobacteria bacterium]|nr:lasso RiPP family leader peptide-containing protein [Deltaproteobacteria bacterium]
MEKEKIQVEKQAYEKPVLTKHGKLTEITTRTGSVKPGGDLCCTRF